MIGMMGVCWMLGLRWVAVVWSLPSPRPHPRPLSRWAGEGPGVFLAGRGFWLVFGGCGRIGGCGENHDGHDGLWLFGALVLGWRGGCLPCPALLSAPVALALALSRRAGEGIPLPPLPSIPGFPLSGDGVEWWFWFGESFFLRRALRFLRDAWAVHERPLRLSPTSSTLPPRPSSPKGPFAQLV